LHQIQPEWGNVVAFVFKVLQHRLQDPDLTTVDTQPQPLDLQGLTRAGRTAIIDILSYYSSSDISQYIHSDQAIDHWRDSPTTMLAFYIFFSPTRYPLPPSGFEVLRAVLQYKGNKLIHLLAQECPQTTGSHEDKFGLLVLGLSKVLEDLDVDLTTSLRYLEIIFGVRFKVQQAAPIELPDDPFTVQGDMEAWPWSETIPLRTGLYASQYVCIAMHRALRHMKRPATAHIFKALVQSGAQVTATPQPPSSRFIDGLVGLWNITFANLRYFPYDSKVQTVMEECFTMKESTFALLTACGRLKPHIVIQIQQSGLGPLGPSLLLEGM
jgi:hypothetical protein